MILKLSALTISTMKTRNIITLVLAVFVTSLMSAQSATVFRMTGAKSASVLLPDANDETPLSEGQSVPEGSLITVGAGTKLFLRTFQGAITTADANTVFVIETVEKTEDDRETTTLELRSGNLVATLDPTKRGIHDYGVRTPKGVAAARGTNFTISVDGLDVVVTVSEGEVSFDIPELPVPVVLVPGTASTGGASQSLAQAVQNSDPATVAKINTALQAAAAAVATLAADPNNTDGVTSQTLADVVTAAASTGDNSLLAATAAAAAQADPGSAEVVVAAAVAAAPSSATTVVASVTREVVQNTGADAGVIAQTLANTATNTDSSVTVDTTAVTNAVNESLAPTPPAPTPTPPPGETTDPETEVEIEVPNDDIVIPQLRTFSLQLSNGQFIVITLNDLDDETNVALSQTAQGVTAGEVGNGGNQRYTIPQSVITIVGPLSNAQRAAIVSGINTVIADLDLVEVPTGGGVIIVSPSS